MRRLGRCSVPLLIVAGMLLSASPAPAQEGSYLTTAQVLSGRCDPSPVLAGQQTDCRFPLSETLPLDPWGGPYVADADVPWDDDDDQRAACVVEGDELICRGVSTYYPAGSTSIRLVFGWTDTSPILATVRTVDWADLPVVISSAGAAEPYVLPDRPLRVWVDKQPEDDEVRAVVRPRDGGGVVATLSVPRSEDFESVEIDAGSLPPGRYRLHPCVGDDPCEEVPSVAFFQVGTGLLEEALPGWNRVGADRINLVIAGTGFDSGDQFRATATDMLGFDGPLLLGPDYEVVEPNSGGDVLSIAWGPFAVEPLQSSKGLFNIWLLADDVADPFALAHSPPPNGPGIIGVDGFDLPDVQITTLHLQPVGRWATSEAQWVSFTGIGPDLPERNEDLRFAGAYVAVPRWGPLTAAPTFLHELGHALFDLRDEYSNESRWVQHGYPNCAADRAEAEEWWGGMVDEIDPFVHEYIRVMDRYNQWVPATLVDDIRVGYSSGGCYSDFGSGEAYRPTWESIMNGETPVFGAMNRLWAESLLSLWTGRVPVTHASLLVGCLEVRAGSPCFHVLPPGAEGVEVPLVLSGPVPERECRAAVGTLGVKPTVTGVNEIAIGSAVRPPSVVEVVQVVEVVAQEPSAPGRSARPWWPAVLGAGLGGIAIGASVALLWRRRSG